MLNEEQLRHLADLTKIELSDEELGKLGKDLNEILGYVEQIKQIDLDKVESALPAEAFPPEADPPLAGAEAGCPLREDEPQPCDPAIVQQIIDNFPEREGRYLKVPKVIDK